MPEGLSVRKSASCYAVAPMLTPYYYLAYAVRRLLGSDGVTKDFTEWRAVGLVILIQIQLVMALFYVFGRQFFQHGTALQWGYGVAIPIIALTYWALGRRKSYEKSVRIFESWSNRKRTMADVATLLFSIVSVFSPILAVSLVQ